MVLLIARNCDDDASFLLKNVTHMVHLIARNDDDDDDKYGAPHRPE